MAETKRTRRWHLEQAALHTINGVRQAKRGHHFAAEQERAMAKDHRDKANRIAEEVAA